MAVYTFTNLIDILGVPVPVETVDSKSGATKPAPPAIEVWHALQPGFGVRIMKPRKDGKVRRAYISRLAVLQPDGKWKEDKPVLGLVQDLGTGEKELTYKQAEAIAYKLVSDAKARKAGGTVRMTVGDAYAKLVESLGEKMSPDSPAYGKKMRGSYDRFLAHLSDRYLDQLKEGFWIDYLRVLRQGQLQVGMEPDKNTGEMVPAMRKAESANYALSVLNAASRLYRLGHDYRGIEGEPKGWDPTRDAARKIETPNKRDIYLALPDLKAAWQATDQLMAPWWRDLWRVYLLTGLRDRLVMEMRFDQIDFKRGLYLIDPLQTGTKRRRSKMSADDRKKAIEMPLSRHVLGILEARKRFAPKGPEGEWVWYSWETTRRTKTKALPLLTDPRASWKRLIPVIGYWCYKHDLRRTYPSIANTVDPTGTLALSLIMLHSSETISKALNIPTITIEYIKGQQRNMRALTEKVSQAVLEIVGELPQTDLTRNLDQYEPLPEPIEKMLTLEERAPERGRDLIEDKPTERRELALVD